MLESQRTWLMVLALALLTGCGGGADPDAGGGLDSGLDSGPEGRLDSGPADAGARDASSDAASPVVDSGAADADVPSDGGDPMTCTEIVECRPVGDPDFRCGYDSCPAACGALTECTACASHAMPSAIQAYFDSLALPVVELEGSLLHCGPATCSLTADFNGDGTDDWAGMFRNLEPRGGNFVMDLLIIYSDGAGGYQHIQYPYFGRVVGGSILTYLVLQNPGAITVGTVTLTVANPSIRVYRVGEGSARACYRESLLVSWDGSMFVRNYLSIMP